MQTDFKASVILNLHTFDLTVDSEDVQPNLLILSNGFSRIELGFPTKSELEEVSQVHKIIFGCDWESWFFFSQKVSHHAPCNPLIPSIVANNKATRTPPIQLCNVTSS